MYQVFPLYFVKEIKVQRCHLQIIQASNKIKFVCPSLTDPGKNALTQKFALQYLEI